MSVDQRISKEAQILALSNRSSYVHAILLLAVITILAGIVLRLCGFVGGDYSWFTLSGAQGNFWMPIGSACEHAMLPTAMAVAVSAAFGWPPDPNRSSPAGRPV